MNWIQSPETVRRFTPHQIFQHWLAAALFVCLLATALIPGFGVSAARGIHVAVGIAGAAFLVYHAMILVAVGIRYDLPAEKAAILPWGREWGALRGNPLPDGEVGKYCPEEKGDYLAILAWSLFLAFTGIVLRWPSVFGVPSASAYGWLRAAHAGFGAALTVHLLLFHIPGRWLRAPKDLRRSIFGGTVPLREAERRGGWVSDLVARGVLVRAPEENVPEEQRETERVRELLELGNRLAREGRYGEACNSYEEALRLLPEYSQARFNYAVALQRNGRTAEAREQLKIFIERDPFNPMVERARGMLASAEGEGK